MSTLVEQLSVLDRYDAWQRAGKKPQLAFYRYKQWEQLFVYSYSPNSLSEIPHYLLTTITHYVSYLLGRVDFDSIRIDTHKKSLRTRAIAHIYTFGEQRLQDSLRDLQSTLTTLSSSKVSLCQEIDSLTITKNVLDLETRKLDARTENGLKNEIEKLKKEIDFWKSKASASEELQKKINKLEGKISSHEGANGGLRHKIKKLENACGHTHLNHLSSYERYLIQYSANVSKKQKHG